VYVTKALTGVRLAGMRTLLPLVKDVAGDVDNWKALGQLLLHMVFIGTMHFMDKYNFDLERLQMCVIHQILPDGSRVPFCSYQTLHRPAMERMFSIPVEEWRSRRASEQEEELIPMMEETIPTLSGCEA
nr:hypothetical protein [Candidatus Njordarchaeum guaymaensis]